MEEPKIFSKRKVLYGSMLVAGTAIGAGMLALPLASAEAGFWPACMVYLFCWLFSTTTGLFMAEISLSLTQKEGNLVSMAKHYLGPLGKVTAWILYLFLFYLLTIAYISGGGQMINSALFSGSAPLMSFGLFTAVFAIVVFWAMVLLVVLICF
jgi:tyrosine-specific transport protein